MPLGEGVVLPGVDEERLHLQRPGQRGEVGDGVRMRREQGGEAEHPAPKIVAAAGGAPASETHQQHGSAATKLTLAGSTSAARTLARS